MPSTRISTVTARSLLLPPIRVPLHALQWFCRPRCAAPRPHCLEQRRPLHLYKTARAKTPLGMHKILSFSPYKLPPPSQSEHRVNLVQGSSGPPIMVAENITLQELYDQHVKTGEMLYCEHQLGKATAKNIERLRSDDDVCKSRNFAILKAHTTLAQVSKGRRSKFFNSLKVILFELATPVAHLKIVLDRMYQFLELGCPIEVRTRLRGSKLSKAEQREAGDATAWPWMHERFPHLRPDFIIKAMPEGTFFLIEPWSNGRSVQWVMSRKVKNMPRRKLQTRVQGMKLAVEKSIEQGRQSQLPVYWRQQLQDEGNAAYSADSGLPQRVTAKRESKVDMDGRYLVPRRMSPAKYRRMGAGSRWKQRGRAG